VLKNPANRHKAVLLSQKQFHYAFCNTMSMADSNAAHDRYAIPGPGHILFEGAMANFDPHSALAVDFHKADRAPLLFIAGGADHIVPASTNRANLKKYGGATGVGYKEFPGRSHFTCGQDGWEEVADHALAWAQEKTSS
jgi:pimeloyl-ACP methyl ester carboxylesterase